LVTEQRSRSRTSLRSCLCTWH